MEGGSDGTLSHIMKEQLQLVKAEAELNKMIKSINEYLNELVVENLQLNAMQCDEMLTQNSSSEQKGTGDKPLMVKSEAPADINLQKLNLNINNKPYFCSNEEEDESD